MNKVKKALIATSMAGIMAVGAGVGTYSWFTASESTEAGTIEAGTLTLNDISEYQVFGADNIQPIDPDLTPELITEGETITVENTGSLDMVPRFQLDIDIKDKDGNDALESLSDEYMITMNFTRHDMDYSETITKPASLFLSRDFVDPEWFPNDDGFKYELGSGASFDVSFDVYLDKDAGNEYQGSSLEGTLHVEGKQTVDGAEYPEE